MGDERDMPGEIDERWLGINEESSFPVGTQIPQSGERGVLQKVEGKN